MEFHCGDLEFGWEDEDDVFYAELRRQVLMLTADDEDEDFEGNKWPSFNVSTSRRSGLSRSTSCSAPLQPGSYYNWCERENADDAAVPAWLVNLWRSGNGTGVFIPQIVKTRRYMHGKMNKRRRSGHNRGGQHNQI